MSAHTRPSYCTHLRAAGQLLAAAGAAARQLARGWQPCAEIQESRHMAGSHVRVIRFSTVRARPDQTCTRDQIRSALHSKLDRSDLILISICTTSLIDQIKLARYSARQAWSIRSSLHNIKRLHSSDTSSVHQHYDCGVLADFCGQIRSFFVI